MTITSLGSESASPPPAPFASHDLESAPKRLDPGMALCLSGGGYRAMLFHVGALWRLYEAGVLLKLERVSSVSGGSITAAVLALAWKKLHPDPHHGRQGFVDLVVKPIRRLGARTIDAPSILGGVLLPGSICDKIAAAYRKHLFDKRTLQDLPDHPRFVINASNVQSGALWRFSKPYMRDWRVGEVKNPKVELAVAVAASSAFPPVLSPLVLDLEEKDYTPKSGADLQREPFTTEVVLTDGGVYDNLGLETVWKSFETVLVSDGGGKMKPEAEPKQDWVQHAYRIINLLDNQVGSLRCRQVIDSFQTGARKGAYWGIRTDIEGYKLPTPIPFPKERAQALAEIPTRLKALEKEQQEGLIDWGYAICDAAIRRYLDGDLPPGCCPYSGFQP